MPIYCHLHSQTVEHHHARRKPKNQHPLQRALPTRGPKPSITNPKCYSAEPCWPFHFRAITCYVIVIILLQRRCPGSMTASVLLNKTPFISCFQYHYFILNYYWEKLCQAVCISGVVSSLSFASRSCLGYSAALGALPSLDLPPSRQASPS